jgi:hypothetical protein
MFNSVKAGCSVRIAELERGDARSFASKVNKSIRGAVSYVEANTDTPGASFHGKVLKVRIRHTVQREDGASRRAVPTKDRRAHDSAAKTGKTDRIASMDIDSA